MSMLLDSGELSRPPLEGRGVLRSPEDVSMGHLPGNHL